ncbi:MAG TPA: DNA repair protein RecN [Oscillospiraceae bacterium]|jgi:DNA repair protein RecN (Recombination protein N)|nr:DNA repair protein RecN [Oscillospiraceae bacterium]
MLKTLDIENIAVIEKASVNFSGGLNVLTGETGAGKSIVVDSINAIMGERTSRELVRYGADNAYVSAYFDDICDSALNKLKEFDIELEDDNSLLITRKISANGKSLCKVNGKTVTVSMLKEICSYLVNVHGQHDSQALLNPDLQYNYIDMLLEDKSVLSDYKKTFKKLISVRRKLKSFAKDEDNKESLLELLNFQIEELEKADIKVGEREELTQKRALIQKSEDIIKSLNLAISVINGDDENIGIEQACADVSRTLFKFDETKDVYDVFNDINDKLELAKDKAEALLLSIDFSPEEIEMIDEKLDLYYKFSNKYGQTEQEMLDYLEKAKERRNSILFADEELNRLNEEYENLLNITVKLADKLSVERKKTAKIFEEKVKQELAFLDMPKMQFYVDFNKGNLSSTGYDKIEFLISANPGEPPKSLSKVASGGELSRIMLAIKNIISYNDTIGTLIFDEIDTGVSGRASQKIGLKLKSVSKNTQVICVTHSAQIASNADEHFLIQKKFNDNKTFTCVTPLDFEGRKQELARIMGGLEITDTLLQSAEELLNQNLCSD